MASTLLKRGWWQFYRCTYGVEVPSGFFGRYPVRAANSDVVEAVQALEQAHIGSGYVPTAGGYIGSKRNCPRGIGGRTCESSGKNCSLHNYCIAWDIEYQYNKLGRYYPRRHSADDVFVRDANLHKYSPQHIAAIEGVKNKAGTPLFRWLGWIGDYMHWEIDVPPEAVSVDWTTVPEGVPPVVVPPEDKEDEVVYMLPVLRKGDGLKSNSFGDRTFLNVEVASLQAALRAKGHDDGNTQDKVCGIDGRFWDGTETALKSFQSAASLTVDGIAGEKTYKRLYG